MVATGCNHIYCKDCLDEWIVKRKNGCAVCRRPVGRRDYWFPLSPAVVEARINQMERFSGDEKAFFLFAGSYFCHKCVILLKRASGRRLLQ